MSISKALSNFDILRGLHNMVNVVTYENLMHCQNIDDVLKNNCVVIFYESRTGMGHWVCVFKNDNGYEFFDSYGKKPDESVNFNDDYIRNEKGITYPHLTYLLYKTKKPIVYNEVQLQKYGHGINTCGRWVMSRLALNVLPQEEFAKLFTKNGIPPDKLVSILTKDA